MMDTAGKRSRLWASPSHPAFQSHAVATVRALSRNPDLDGLLLTELRYPTVRLDHSPSAFASFAARSGHTIDAIDDVWRLYVDWSRWRVDELARLIDAVARAAKQANGTDFIVGGAFPSEAVLDHRVVEQTSQDLLRLAPLLDLTVITLSAKVLATDPALLVRTRLAAEAQDGGTDTMLAVTPPLAVGADRDDLHPARSTVLFGDDVGPSRPAPPFQALRLLPDSAMTRTQPPWMGVPVNCADVAPLPSR
jgi:hypothetical protein